MIDPMIVILIIVIIVALMSRRNVTINVAPEARAEAHAEGGQATTNNTVKSGGGGTAVGGMAIFGVVAVVGLIGGAMALSLMAQANAGAAQIAAMQPAIITAQTQALQASGAKPPADPFDWTPIYLIVAGLILLFLFMRGVRNTTRHNIGNQINPTPSPYQIEQARRGEIVQGEWRQLPPGEDRVPLQLPDRRESEKVERL